MIQQFHSWAHTQKDYKQDLEERFVHHVHDSQNMEITVEVSIDRQLDVKMSIYPVEYYSALERKDILTQATMWMSPEDVTLGDICQSQKGEYCIIPLL